MLKVNVSIGWDAEDARMIWYNQIISHMVTICHSHPQLLSDTLQLTHRCVCNFMKNGDIIEGYFHGTGHGVGLEIHEEPRLSSDGSNLKPGMVVTVEPGLYYPGLGGCRIEDMVRLKHDGVEMLSKCHYRWEIS